MNVLFWFDGVKDYLNGRKDIIEKAFEMFLFGSAWGEQKAYQYLKDFGLEKKTINGIDNDKMKQVFYVMRVLEPSTWRSSD